MSRMEQTMKKEDIILRIDQISVPVEHTVEEVVKKAKKTAGIRPKTSCTVQIIRRSIDARKRPDIRYVYSVDLHLPHGTSWRKSAHARLVEAKPFDPFRWNINDSTPRVAVIGSGPAGLFAYLDRRVDSPALSGRGSRPSGRTSG